MREIDPVSLMESRRGSMQVIVKTSFETVDVNAWDELQIDKGDLDVEFQAIGGQIAYWIAISAKFRSTVEAVRRDFDDWYGPLYETEFTKYESNAGRKPNMNSVDYLVRMNHGEEYNIRKEKLDNAEADLKVIEGMTEGLRAKMQALIQIAKRQTTEYEHTDTSFRKASTPVIPQAATQPAYRKASSDASIEEAKTSLKGIIGNKRRPQ